MIPHVIPTHCALCGADLGDCMRLEIVGRELLGFCAKHDPALIDAVLPQLVGVHDLVKEVTTINPGLSRLDEILTVAALACEHEAKRPENHAVAEPLRDLASLVADGRELIAETRNCLALEAAGIPVEEWP